MDADGVEGKVARKAANVTGSADFAEVVGLDLRPFPGGRGAGVVLRLGPLGLGGSPNDAHRPKRGGRFQDDAPVQPRGGNLTNAPRRVTFLVHLRLTPLNSRQRHAAASPPHYTG